MSVSGDSRSLATSVDKLRKRIGSDAVAFIASFLIFIYLLPIFYFDYHLFTTSYFTDPGDDGRSINWFIQVYESFLSSSSNLLAEIHQVTLPFVGAIAASQYKGSLNFGYYVVAALTFVGIVLAVYNQVIIQTVDIHSNLSDFMSTTDPTKFQDEMVAYFRRTRETLFFLLMVLIGLQSYKAK